MPIYGYQRTVINPENGLLELREVCFDFSAADLRRIATFLVDRADRMDAGVWRSDHMHLDEFDRQWARDHPESDVIVHHHGTTWIRD
jgi:hypothetical protein